MFTFFNNSDYNSKIVKIDLFLFNFSLDYAINTLFFNDNTMHQIYEDKGSFNITYQFPQIAYSSLISAVFRIILKYVFLSTVITLSGRYVFDVDSSISINRIPLSVFLNTPFKVSLLSPFE